MSTRSLVGRVYPDGPISAVYVHWDGAPERRGPTLLEHYTDPEKIERLLDLGGLSKLAPELGEKHGFEDKSHEDWCKSYSRDRGTYDMPRMAFRNHQGLYTYGNEVWVEYMYLWGTAKDVPGPSWWVCKVPERAWQVYLWEPLKQATERALCEKSKPHELPL